MPLSTEDLAFIDAALGAAEPAMEALASIRQRMPGVSLTHCDPHDFADEQPFRQYAAFDLYLIGNRGFCARLTADPAEATGIVVTPRKEGGR